MSDTGEKGIREHRDRHDVLKERGYDVDAVRARVVEAARPIAGRVLDVGTGPGRFAILLAKEQGGGCNAGIRSRRGRHGAQECSGCGRGGFEFGFSAAMPRACPSRTIPLTWRPRPI